MLGSLFAFYVGKQLTLSIIVLSAIFVLVLVVVIIKKKLRYFIIPCLAFLTAFGIYSLRVANFNKSVQYSPEIISARVYEISTVKQGSIALKADSCEFDGKEIKSNLNIIIYDNSSLFEDIQVGSIISFKPTKVFKTDLYFNDLPNAKTRYKNLKYTATANFSDVEVKGKDLTLAEQVKDKVNNNLHNGLNNENAELAYSALFGDKTSLGDDIYISYRLSGIAHLLAVSGLHVALIVGVIRAILSLFRVKNNWAKIVLISAFLLFYSYVCDFSSSVVRASIMSILALLAIALGREYDQLNSISIAGIVCFLLNPLCVFDVSFLMSFGCAFGIVLFNKPIKTALIKIKTPEKLAESLSLTISTLLALLIINAVFFRNFNIISMIANVIIIPIFALAFSLVFIVLLISLIIPSISLVLMPLNYVFDIVNVVATTLGNLSFANIPTASLNFIAIPAYFVLTFMISRICLANKLNKVIISLGLVAILVVCLL